MKITLATLLTTTLVSGGLTSLAQADESDRVCEASPQDSAYLKSNRSSRVIIAQGVNEKVDEATQQSRSRSSIQVPDRDDEG